MKNKIIGLVLTVIMLGCLFSCSESEENMPNIPKVKVGNIVYDIKDAQCRKNISTFNKAASAKYRNEVTNILFDEIETYASGSWMDRDGNVTSGPSHNILVLDGYQITKIEIDAVSTINSLPVIVIKDANGVKKIHIGVIANYTKVYAWFPSGLPNGSKVYINDFYANGGSTRNSTSINITYLDTDPRIVTGKNKYSSDLLTNDVYVHYDTGALVHQSGYKLFPLAVKPGDRVWYTPTTKHVAYIDEFGVFLSGALNGNNSVAPANAKAVLISLAAGYPQNMVVTINDSDLTYTPYSYRLNNPQVNDTDSYYNDYQEGQIHFTVKVNTSLFNETEDPEVSADSETLVDVPAVLILPSSYNAKGRAVPLIMVFHGSGYGVSTTAWGWNSESDTNFSTFITNFVTAGYAVCDVNGYRAGQHSTWGCQRALQAYRKLYEYVIKNYNVQHSVNVYGFSMGGIVAMNYASQNRDTIKCIGIGAPVLSLWDEVYNASGVRRGSMAESYGFDYPQGYSWSSGAATAEEITIWENNLDKTIGLDPYRRIVTENQKNYLRYWYPPIRAWHAKDDSSVPYSYTVNFIEALQNTEQNASLRLMTTGGHGISYGTSDVATAEFIMWFNRFNQFE